MLPHDRQPQIPRTPSVPLLSAHLHPASSTRRVLWPSFVSGVMVIIFDRHHVFHRFRSLPFAPAPLKHLKPLCAFDVSITCTGHLFETARSRFGPSCVELFHRFRGILRGFKITHQQFKSSADLDETDTGSQQPQTISTRYYVGIRALTKGSSRCVQLFAGPVLLSPLRQLLESSRLRFSVHDRVRHRSLTACLAPVACLPADELSVGASLLPPLS